MSASRRGKGDRATEDVVSSRTPDMGALAGAVAWHAVSPADALRRLDSGADGLREREATARLARDGPNVFQSTPPVPAWTILLAQLRSVIVLLLVAAMVVAGLTGDWLDAGAIGAVLVLNVAIGFITELRARRAMEALRSLEVARARVVRDGRAREIDASELVSGDVIELEAGRAVPADARLLASVELRTAEAALTGESLPQDKHAAAALVPDTALPDRLTMVYKATTVVAGRARAVVVATGMATEVGRIGTLAGAIRPAPTPLERRLDQLGRRLALAALVVAALVAGLGAVHGTPLWAVVETAIALAVAAVPEGLPAVATIAMAVGVWRMARRRALVRRLPAVETLGAATVICTDKTGTLTAGEMTLTTLRLADREFAVPNGADSLAATAAALAEVATDARARLALLIGVLANRSDGAPGGDPTEIALVAAAARAGLGPEALRAEWPEVGEVPFTSARLLMATFHRMSAAGGRMLVDPAAAGGLVACVKGAPRQILARCDRVLTADGPRPLTPAGRDELERLNHELAGRGLRVLALAVGVVPAAAETALQGLTWVGLAGLSDPPAAGVAETIRAFREAGVRTIMITGDQRRTAASVAHALGLLGPGDATLDGPELEQLSDDALVDAVGRTAVFSRVSPAGKLRIVAACQRRGDIVAMLGDGVNDAAALRKADIGVALGRRGTDLAKEAADLILQDDRFPTVAAAIEEGRVIFENIRRFVFYLFSCNLAEILVFLGAGLSGWPTPLTPLQILWLNLLTDTLPALALAVEPGGRDTMRQAPRDPATTLLPAAMLRAIAGYALLIAGGALAAFAWGLAGIGGVASLGRAATLAFMTLAFGQIFHLGNARSAGPVLAPRAAVRNRYALAAVGVTVLLQLLAAFCSPLARVLRIVALSPLDWMLVAGLGLLPGIVGQTIKVVRGRRRAAHRAMRLGALPAVFIALAGAFVGTAVATRRLEAQVDHQHHHADTSSVAADTSPAMPAGMPMSLPAGMPARPFGIPMTRMGSGTAWLPDASAMRAWHFMAGGWTLMVHGDAFLQYDHQGGPRGDDQIGSINWAMLMAMRPLAGGTLHLHGMASAEPFTISDGGYPLLLQTGESYQGAPLHDRQHPHDLFMELSALYERAVTSRFGVMVYAAPVGEPGIGPVAYMHRPSALNDPFAPLSHHWTDATHITYGVLTGGIFTRAVKLEGTLFNGREPDEDRDNFDFHPLDSYGFRLSAVPTSRWALSASYGYLRAPEALRPDENQRRLGASVLHTVRLGRRAEWAAALVYGANQHMTPGSGSGPWEHSALIESNVQFDAVNSIMARVEYVRKSGEDLVIPGAASREFDLGTFSLGYVREFAAIGGATLGLGARGAINMVPRALADIYGSRTPAGLAIFVRVRPALLEHGKGMDRERQGP